MPAPRGCGNAHAKLALRTELTCRTGSDTFAKLKRIVIVRRSNYQGTGGVTWSLETVHASSESPCRITAVSEEEEKKKKEEEDEEVLTEFNPSTFGELLAPTRPVNRPAGDAELIFQCHIRKYVLTARGGSI